MICGEPSRSAELTVGGMVGESCSKRFVFGVKPEALLTLSVLQAHPHIPHCCFASPRVLPDSPPPPALQPPRALCGLDSVPKGDLPQCPFPNLADIFPFPNQRGDFRGVLSELNRWQAWHLKCGNYLLLREKLETICWRNLARRT